MLENLLDAANTSLACSSSSPSPKENLSSCSSTSSRSGSFCHFSFKTSTKKLRKKFTSKKLKRKFPNSKGSFILKKKLKLTPSSPSHIYSHKLKRYASLSSASSTSSSASSSSSCSPNTLNTLNTLDTNPQESAIGPKKPMKLHKFYHSVPFKCPFCFTFKEIPAEFIDHLTSIHFSDVKLLYEKKCTKLIEQAENQLKISQENPGFDENDLREIPNKLKKLMENFERDEENNDEEKTNVQEEEQEEEEEVLNNQIDEEIEDCLSNVSSEKNNTGLDKEQEIHTPPKTPPMNQGLINSDEKHVENSSNPAVKSSYLTMNSSLLPPRKQQRLLKSPFVQNENLNDTLNNMTCGGLEGHDQNTNTFYNQNTLNDQQKPIKHNSFSVPSLLSSSIEKSQHSIISNNLEAVGLSQLNRQPNTTTSCGSVNQEASMKCAICDRGFEYYSNLRRHIKTKHKIYGKQVKDFVIRHNINSKQNQNESNTTLISPASHSYNMDLSMPIKYPNGLIIDQKNNDESLDDDMEQDEAASSTSTASSYTSSSHMSSIHQASTLIASSTSKIYSNIQSQQKQINPQSNTLLSSSSSTPSSNYSNNIMAAIAAAAAANSQLQSQSMGNLNQQQMMAFLTHTNAMSKIKSSLLESLLSRKLPSKFGSEIQQGLDNTTESNEANKNDKMNNFTKLIQNIVEMNQMNHFNNSTALAAMQAASTGSIGNKVKTELIEGSSDNAKESELYNGYEHPTNLNQNDKLTENSILTKNSESTLSKPRHNRRYNQLSAFYPLKHKTDEESDVDLYDEEEGNNNKKEENSFCEYEETDLDQEKNMVNKSLNEIENDNEEDLEENDDDIGSRTSSSRSYRSVCESTSSIQLHHHHHHQQHQLQSINPSTTPNKFLFSNNPPSASPQINQLVLENHLRSLTQQNFNHHYQTYQQNLHRNFSLTNTQFTNPNQAMAQNHSDQSPPPVPPSNGIRRKRSKDFSISSNQNMARNLQCSPSNTSIENGSNSNSNSNQIRFSTEIWRCPYCCYETTSASRYNSHLVCHGWKPYLCPHCGSRSNRLPDMRTHISTFHPEFNVNTFVVLSEEEAKSTLKDYMKNRALINRKLKEMRPQPKFKCKLCPYASLYQFNLTKHVKSVHLSDAYHHSNNNNNNSNSNVNHDS